MANVTLKVSVSAYQDKINKLEGYLNRLDSTITDYETAEKSMDKFIGEGDDNYEALRQNIEQNIATCRKAREMCDASIKALNETLSQMTDAGQNIGNLLSEAGGLAKSTISAAIEVANLVN